MATTVQCIQIREKLLEFSWAVLPTLSPHWLRRHSHNVRLIEVIYVDCWVPWMIPMSVTSSELGGHFSVWSLPESHTSETVACIGFVSAWGELCWSDCVIVTFSRLCTSTSSRLITAADTIIIIVITTSIMRHQIDTATVAVITSILMVLWVSRLSYPCHIEFIQWLLSIDYQKALTQGPTNHFSSIFSQHW